MVRRSHRRWSLLGSSSGLGGSSGGGGGGSAHNRATSPPSQRHRSSKNNSPPPQLRRSRTDGDALADMKRAVDIGKQTPSATAAPGLGVGPAGHPHHPVVQKRPSCTTLTVNDIRRSVSYDYGGSADYLTNDSSNSSAGSGGGGGAAPAEDHGEENNNAGGKKTTTRSGRRTSLSNISSWGAKMGLKKKKITRRASMTHPTNTNANNNSNSNTRQGRLNNHVGGNGVYRRSQSTGEEPLEQQRQRRAVSATSPMTPLEDILRHGHHNKKGSGGEAEGEATTKQSRVFGSVPLNLNSMRSSTTTSGTRNSLTTPRKNWSFNRSSENSPLSLMRSTSTGSKTSSAASSTHHQHTTPGKNWSFNNNNYNKDTSPTTTRNSYTNNNATTTTSLNNNNNKEKEMDLDDLVQTKNDHHHHDNNNNNNNGSPNNNNGNQYIHPSFLNQSWSSSGAGMMGGRQNRTSTTGTSAQTSIQQMIPRNVVRAPVMATKKIVRSSVMAGESVVQAGSSVVRGGVQAGEAVIRVSAGGASAVVDAATKASFAVVDVGTKAGNAVVDTCTRTSTSIKNTGQAVVEGTTQAVACGANQIVSGGRAVVEGTTQVVMDGSKQIVQTSTNIVVGGSKVLVESTQQGGKMVYEGGKNFGKRLKRIASKGHHPFQLPRKRQKSRWEESIEIIDELLDPKSQTYAVMTEEQRRKLGSVKRCLLKDPNGDTVNKTQHVPQELVRIQSMPKVEDGGDVYEYDEEGNPISRRASTKGMRRNSTFILQEYAGVTDTESLHMVMDDDSGRAANNNENHPADVTDDERSVFSRTLSAASTFSNDDCCSIDDDDREDEELAQDNDDNNNNNNNNKLVHPPGSIVPGPVTRAFSVDKDFLPAEFTYMEYSQQKELCNLLSWDSMLSWDFDVFRLNEVTNGKPLLFLGWAILSAPYAQQAMERELGVNTTTADAATDAEADASHHDGYSFVEELSIPFNKLCNYLRIIEADYTEANPYHNAMHASDVLQTIHALIQKSKDETLLKDVPQINIFAILLGAVVHDVEHPGKTNAFHIKVRSELAVNYNDSSVLENHHVAHAFARMLNLDLREAKAVIDGESVKARISFKYDQNSDCNILCNATGDQFDTIRKHMIDAILHTDMTKHFAMVNAARGMLMEEEQCKKEEQSWRVLVFMLHMADISSQAKGPHLFKKWSLRCLEEFFLQGDEEADLGLPISPLCDRNSTSIPESQVGFIKYVVEPSFAVLAQYSSFVQEKVLPIIDSNLNYWFAEQEGLEIEGGPATEAATTTESTEGQDDKAEVQPPEDGVMAVEDVDSESYGSDYSY